MRSKNDSLPQVGKHYSYWTVRVTGRDWELDINSILSYPFMVTGYSSKVDERGYPQLILESLNIETEYPCFIEFCHGMQTDEGYCVNSWLTRIKALSDEEVAKIKERRILKLSREVQELEERVKGGE